jgi:hypothetical protein
MTAQVVRESPAERDRRAASEGGGPVNGNASYFVGWGTLSLINAGLAQAKGRNGLLWWLLSLLLGPVATLLIVVLPPDGRWRD